MFLCTLVSDAEAGKSLQVHLVKQIKLSFPTLE